MPKRPPILNTTRNFTNLFVNKMHPVYVNTLTNGFKIATEKKPGAIATVGFYSKSGSRFETKNTNGTAHLLQRAMWKGTASRSATDIQEAIAALGGDIKFTTDRELQSVKITCLKSDIPAAIELIGDVVRECTLDEKSITDARPECLENMKDWEDDVDAQVEQGMHMSCYDTTEDMNGMGLGLPIYGEVSNINGGLLWQDIQAYYKNAFLQPKDMFMVVTGAEDENAINTQCDQLFHDLKHTGYDFEPDKRYVGGDIRRFSNKFMPTHASWVMLGWEICPADSQDTLPLQVIMECHGGYDRFHHDHTSNFAIRNMYENAESMSQYGGQGMPHFVRPFWHLHSDTGLMGMYYLQPLSIHMGYGQLEMPWRLGLEWQSYCMRFEEKNCEVGKNKVKSKLVLAMDGVKSSNDYIAHQLMYAKRWIPLEEQLARVDNLTTAIVSDTINHYFYDRDFVTSSFSDFKMDMPNYLANRGMVNKSIWY